MRAVVPAEMNAYVHDWQMSPGLEAGGFLFLTGVTGVARDGTVPRAAADQIREAFSQATLILSRAGLDWGAVVDVTSFHVGLQDQSAAFRAVWAEHVRPPYPAWTAVEVVGLMTPGAVVELKLIARTENAT